MPLTPEQIAAAGPWAVLVAILLAGIVALFTLVVRRIVVPGWMFDRSEAERKISDAQAERNADSLAVTSKANADLAAAYLAMARSYDRIERRLEALERRRVKDE